MSEMANKPGPGSLSERVQSLRLTDSNDGSGSGLWWLPWVICVVLFFATGLFALEALAPINDDFLKKLAEERGLNIGQGNQGAQRISLPGSSETNLTAADIALESKGYIVPIQLIQVSPKVSGTVMKLNIEEGKFVKKDFALAQLEKVEYKSDFDHASGVLKAAQARIDELKKWRADEIAQTQAELDDAVALLKQMSAKFARTEELKKSDAVAIEDVEAAESGFRSMKARVDRLQLAFKMIAKQGPRDAKIAALEAELQQGQADWDKADWRLKNTVVRAPIDGIILSKKTEEGNIVNPAAFSNGLSASLCEMADLHKMEVDLSVAERDIAKVFANQECRIRAEAFPNRYYAGYVSRIMPMADRSKSSVPVRVLIQFPAMDAKGKALPPETQGEFLRPEMGAIVTFLNRKIASASK